MIKKFFNKPIVIISFVLYLLLTLLIFISSLTSGEDSGEQSAFVWSIISNILNIEGDYELFVRKALGHFSFFLTLAIFASVVYYRLVEITFTKHQKLYHVIITLLVGMLTATLAEVFQLPIFVSGRSANIVDVLIDFSGFVLGFILYSFIKFLRLKKA